LILLSNKITCGSSREEQSNFKTILAQPKVLTEQWEQKFETCQFKWKSYFDSLVVIGFPNSSNLNLNNFAKWSNHQKKIFWNEIEHIITTTPSTIAATTDSSNN